MAVQLSIFEKVMNTIRLGLDGFIEEAEERIGGYIGRARKRSEDRSAPVSEADHKRAARYLEIGREYYNKKDYKKALKRFKGAARKDPNYGLAHYYLGLALYKSDRVKAAAKSWERVLSLEPKSSETWKKAAEKLESPNLGRKRVVRAVDNQGQDL